MGKAICEGIIPEEYPIEISGKRCRGGVFDGEKQLTPSECRTQYKVHDIKKAKKRCRKKVEISKITKKFFRKIFEIFQKFQKFRKKNNFHKSQKKNHKSVKSHILGDIFKKRHFLSIRQGVFNRQ